MTRQYLLFILYIVFPKLDLLPMGGSAVRVTDLIFMLALVLYLQEHGLRIAAIPMVQNYLLFIAAAVLSLVVNAEFDLFSVLNILRLFEYLFWAYVGYEAAPGITPERFSRDMQYVALFLFAWVSLEYLNLIPKVGKFTSVSDRVSGNTSGPFEIAVIGSFLFFVTRNKLSKGVSFIILLLSQARITIVATLFLSLLPHWRRVLPMAVIALPFMLLIPWSAVIGQTRFASIPDISDFVLSPMWYWQRTQDIKPAEALNPTNSKLLFTHTDEVSSNSESELSFEIRALRWTVIVKSAFSTPGAFLFGYGPGAWGVGVDGYYFRLLGEFGALGTLLFGWMIWRAFRDSSLPVDAKDYLACLLVTALFIDIFVTDKPMSLLWFYVGLSSNAARMSSATKPIIASMKETVASRLSFATLLSHLLSGAHFIAIGAIAGLSMGAIYLNVFSSPVYTASAVIGPAESHRASDANLLPMYAGLGLNDRQDLTSVADFGSGIQFSDGTSLFPKFLEVLYSVRAADDLERKYHVMEHVFHGWDRASSSWKPTSDIWQWLIHFLRPDVPGAGWSPPTSTKLAEFFRAFVLVEPVVQTNAATTGLYQVSITFPDRVYAIGLLNNMLQEADMLVRQDQLSNTANRIGYLNNVIGGTQELTLRENLQNILQQDEQSKMTLQADKFFSVDVVDPPHADISPASPNAALILTAASLGGAGLAGLLLLLSLYKRAEYRITRTEGKSAGRMGYSHQ